jgi:hypothetical protein
MQAIEHKNCTCQSIIDELEEIEPFVALNAIRCSSHPLSDQALNENFPKFVEELYIRLRGGADTYGDSSLVRKASEIIREQRQEARDISGWGFILDCRLAALEAVIVKLEALTDDPQALLSLIEPEK